MIQVPGVKYLPRLYNKPVETGNESQLKSIDNTDKDPLNFEEHAVLIDVSDTEDLEVTT
jgi:hypothetical protein